MLRRGRLGAPRTMKCQVSEPVPACRNGEFPSSKVIIILNGVPNAGKSTVARLLVEKLPNTAHLEIDLLREITSELRERIKYLYSTDMNDPSIGTFIDNSGH